MAPLPEGSISSTLAGTQDTRWGSPTSLEGELGAVAIFHEALQASALQVLSALGPNETAPFKPEGGLHELGTKLLLHYSPQVFGGTVGSTLLLSLPCSHILSASLQLTFAACSPCAPRPVRTTSAWTCPLAMDWMAA